MKLGALFRNNSISKTYFLLIMLFFLLAILALVYSYVYLDVTPVHTAQQAGLIKLTAFAGRIVLLLLFFFLIWRILQSIVRPLHNLSKATEALIHGENFPLQYLDRNDEIGRLSRSFQQLALTVQEKEDELTAQNEELRTQQEELQANQKQLQQTLLQLESMNKALDQSSGVAVLDQHGVYQHVNYKLCEWLQYKPEQLLGKPYRILFPSTVAAAGELQEIADVTGTGGIWSGSIQNRRSDGSLIWMQSSLVPYVNPQGQVYQYVLIANNISQVKQTEARLVESLQQTERTKEILERHNELNHALTYTLDKQEFADTFLRHIDRLYTLHTGLFLLLECGVAASKGLRDETVGQFTDGSMEGLYTRLSQERSFVIQRESEPSERGIAQDSRVFCYDYYAGIFNSRGVMIAVFCATRIGHPFRDGERNEIDGLMNRVSLALERIIIFDEMEKSQKLNQDIINNVNEGIQFVDTEGRMLHSNKALGNLFEHGELGEAGPVGKEQWISRLAQRSKESGALRKFLEEAIATPSIKERSMNYSIAGEITLYMEVYAMTIFQQNVIIGTIFVHRDMTKEYEVDQMKSELVSTVSHELRTPLSSVLGFAELLLSKELKPERRQKYVETIHKEATRLTNLINDFLDLQRMESGNQQYVMEICTLDKLVMETINQFKHESRHQVTFLDEAKEVRVQADKDRMMQVFTNVMSNALKFSPEGGRITLRLFNDAEKVTFSIQDEGVGIPSGELPKLFQKFKRIDNSASRNVGGTGLGLVICKEIINKHNGSIWIESEEGVGTTLYFSLPLLDPPPVHMLDGDLPPETGAGADAKVMIVEDDMSLALLLSEELKMNGFKVIHHYNPKFALQDALKMPLVGIVIDLMLGDDLDGWGLIRELKAHTATAEIPIVVSSALDQSEKKIRRFHIEKYLTKPYPSSELTKVIKEFFSRRPQHGDIAFPEN